MSIEAYLNQDENETVEELKDLNSQAYKNIADDLSITQAEQSIIDEIVGVDGDDEEQEKEELEQEKEFKTLFESLYEIDPDTKEVFVKGSAYDLKKWEDDMVCFAFGDPTRVVALEDSISPEERTLNKAYAKIQFKKKLLTSIIQKHSLTLKAKTINKDLARDFQRVMGFQIPNLRMESFTDEPSPTNYTVAMEEMTGAQMAMAAGGALVGLGIIYKMIQWFSRALNKNGAATNSISQNFKEASERKQRIAAAGDQHKISRDMINQTVKDFTESFKAVKVQGEGDEVYDFKIETLKQVQSSVGTGDEVDTNSLFDGLVKLYMADGMKNNLNPFTRTMIEGRISKEWWTNLSVFTASAIEMQRDSIAEINNISRFVKLPETSKFIDFKIIDQLEGLLTVFDSEIKLPKRTTLKNGSSNHVEVIEAFVASYHKIFSKLILDKNLIIKSESYTSFTEVETEAFAKFTEDYLKEIENEGKQLQTQLDNVYGKGKNESSLNEQDLDTKRQRIDEMVREFKSISNLLRFTIAVRNALGKLSIALNVATAEGENTIVKLVKSAKGTIDSVTGVATDVVNTLTK